MARHTLQLFRTHEQTLMGIGVIGLFAAFSKVAGAGLSYLYLRLPGGLLHALVCLLIGEGRLLAGHALDFQRLLQGYCLLASVIPLLHCLLGLR